MLSGLDDLPWGDYRHAYGPADDVPQALRQLTARQAKVRSAAYDRLFSTIAHQGAIYSATAQAVPFLLALLRQSDLPDRHKLLDLLIAIREGGSWHAAHRDELIAEGDFSLEDYEEAVSEELYWVEQTYAAVDRGLGMFIKQLGSDDPRVRARAARLLAVFHHRRDLVLPAMQSHYAFEQDEVVKASTLMGIVRLIADKFDEAEAALDKVWAIEGSPLVRLIAAQLLTVYRRGDVSSEIAIFLLDAFSEPGALVEAYRAYPWAKNDLRTDLIPTLEMLGEAYRAHTVHALADFVREESSALFDAERTLPPLLSLAFGGPLSERPALDTPQREALQALLDSPYDWADDPAVKGVLRSFNLPARPDVVRRLLA
jgi:hypothetical protein